MVGSVTGMLTVSFFTLFVTSFSVGLGAIVWIYLSEIYPIEIRPAALSACGVINWVVSFAVVFGGRFLTLEQAVLVFGTICFFGAVGISLWVVETTGCSADDSPLTPRSNRSNSVLLTPPGNYHALDDGESDSEDDIDDANAAICVKRIETGVACKAAVVP